MSTRRRSAGAALALVTAAAVLLTGCTGAPAPDPTPHEAAPSRPVTSEEAQLLAIARFTNFDTGSRPFRASVDEGGTLLTLRGWVDYESQLGYAMVSGDFDPQALLFTSSTVGIAPTAPDAAGDPPLPIRALSDTVWQSRPLDPGGSRLDALLATIGNLGNDRPDNPLLVQQSGALWVSDEAIDGTPVTVFASPPSDEPLTGGAVPRLEDSPLRLWVSASGLILRAEVRLGDAWTIVELPDAAAPRLELPEGDG